MKGMEMYKDQYQGLADLGYPRELWDKIDPTDITKIINDQISYQKYLEDEKTKVANDLISEEFKRRYKEAYENLALHVSMVNDLGDSLQQERLKKVLNLLGQSNDSTEIIQFISENKDILSDEEMSILNMKKEWLEFNKK